MEVWQTSIGPLHIIRPLGEGSHGRVWLVHDPRLKKDVALKELRMVSAASPVLETLRQEFRVLCGLHHPGLVSVHHFGRVEKSGRHFFTCEFIEGKNAGDFLRGRDLAEKTDLIRQVLETLQYIHSQGIFHLDLKNDNILVTGEEGVRAWLVDFGLAQAFNQGGPRVVAGTPATMAPEMQVSGTVPTARADLYSLGILIYQWLTGEWPFPAGNVRAVLAWHATGHLPPAFFSRMDIPDHLKQLVQSLLHKKPQERLPQAAAALRFIKAAQGEGSTPRAMMPRTDPWVGRKAILKKFDELMRELLQDQPGILKMNGAKGMGKSRLLQVLRQQLEVADVRVVRVSTDAASGPFLQLEEQLGICRVGPVDLAETLPRPTSNLWSALVARRTALLIDDLDACEKTFQTWCETLFRQLEPYRLLGQSAALLVVATGASLSQAEKLSPLSQDEVRKYLGHFLPGSVAEAFAPVLYDWSGGVPQRVQAGFAHCREKLLSGQTVREIDMACTDDAVFENLWQSLSAHHRDVLASLACNQGAVKKTDLERVFNLSAHQLDEDLALLAEQNWVSSDGAEIRMHSFLQKSVRLKTCEADKIRVARRWLEMGCDTTAMDLAHLYEWAGEPLQAAAQFRQAAIESKSRHDFVQARCYFSSAAKFEENEFTRSGDFLECARMSLIVGEVETAEKYLQQAATYPSSPWHELHGWTLLRRKNPASARTTFLQAMETLPAQATYPRVRLMNTLAQLEMQQGRHAEAIRQYEAALKLEENLSTAEKKRGTNNQLALACAHQGDFLRAREILQEQLAVPHLDPHQEIHTQGQLGYVCLEAQDFAAAAAALERACELARCHDDFDQYDINLGNLFNAQHRLCHYTQARTVLDELFRFQKQQGRVDLWPALHLKEAALYLSLGQKDALVRSLQQGREAAQKLGQNTLHTWFDLFAAHGERQFGDPVQAMHFFEKLHDSDVVAWADLALAEMLIKSDPSRARALLAHLPDLKDAVFCLKKKSLMMLLDHAAEPDWRRFLDECEKASCWEVYLETISVLLPLVTDPAWRRQLAQSSSALRRKILAQVPEEFRSGFVQEKTMNDSSYKRILQISSQLAREKNPQKLLVSILDYAIEFSGAEQGLMLSRNDEGDLVVLLARDMSGRDVPEPHYSQSVARRVLLEGKAFYTADATLDESTQIFSSVMVHQLKSVLCAPLRQAEKVTGVIYLMTTGTAHTLEADFMPALELFAEQASLALENAAALEQKSAELGQLQHDLAARDTEIANLTTLVNRAPRSTLYAYDAIVGRSKKMEEVFKIMDRISNAKVPVFVHGESGTGKELIARALHQNSARAKNPFMAINCSAFSETLLESELFGHCKGAFTGADRDRAGLFEVASSGTIFLDEIGDMPLVMQAKILRVLQEQEVMRVGGRTTAKIDVRVVSASNKDLRAQVKTGSFREDLLFRLCGITLHLPPLRERIEDIPLLAKHFIDKIARENQLKPVPKISRGALEKLMAHAWPGNIRELEQALTTAALMADHGVIQPENLLLQGGLLSPAVSSGVGDVIAINRGKSMADYEKEIILKTYEMCGNNKSHTALALGLSRLTLHKKLQEYGVN